MKVIVIFFKISALCLGLFIPAFQATAQINQGKPETITNGTLSIKVTPSNPCNGTNNGFIKFDVVSSDGDALIQVFGPVSQFAQIPVSQGGSFTHNAGNTLPDGNYNFIIVDNTSSITSLFGGTPVGTPAISLTDLSAISISTDVGTNLANSSCATPNGAIITTISGGSASLPGLAGGGSFQYSLLKGASPFASGVLTSPYQLTFSNLSAGVYTLNVDDDFSSCGGSMMWTISDPSPLLFAVSTLTTPVCIGSGGTVDLANSETGVTYEVFKGGVATGITLPGSTGSSLAFTIPAAQLTPVAIYNFTVRAVNGSCTPAFMSGTATITVTPANTAGAASSTPTLCINTALTNITHTTTGATGISNDGVSGANGLPAGVSAAWLANVITISGTPTASGTFNYSIPLTGGCGSVNATGTITVTPANTAGAASSTPTLCISTALTDITHSTTGATGIGAPTGLPAGVSAAWLANVITISGTPTASGTFNYSIPLTGGCGSVNATGTITVTPANTAGAASSTPTLCINTALTNITHTTTGATGISNDGVSGANGLPAGVSAAWLANVITISGTPTASGTFNYSIPLTGGCGSVNATGTITVTPANTAGAASSTPTLCINTALTNITHATTGATGISNDGVSGANGLPAGVSAAWLANVITISGTPTASGTFNYSIPLTGGCGSVNATGTITVTPANTAGAASSTPTLCISTALTDITHSTTGATGIGAPTGLPAGVSAAWLANVITISGTPTASGTFNYSIPLTGGCGSVNATGTITVTPANTAGAASSTPTLCINTALTNITHTTTGATGISNDGVSGANGLPAGVSAAWLANVITISGTPTASGTFNYSIPLTGGCGSVNATGTITVTPANTAGAASSTPTLCISTALTDITHSTTGATGIGAPTGLPAGVSAAWLANVITISGTPTASGTFNYNIPLTGGCGSVNATGTITVTLANTAGVASSTPTLCINTALTNITHATTGATGISNDGVSGANGLPAGVSAAWLANVITISGTPTASGTFNYSIPLTGGCGSVNATGTITVTLANTAGAASSTPTLCINTALTNITHTTTGATGISNDGVSGANGLPAGVSAAWLANVITISGTPTASGTFNYSIPLTGGCGSVNATGTITVTPANTAGAASSTPTLCINTALTNITHATTGATGISNDGVSGTNGLPAGVSAAWLANVITISGTPTASGTFNYSIPLTGGCGSVNATGTITVTPANTAGVASSTPTLCINTALTNITHTTTGATGISNDGVSGANGLPAGVSAAWLANVITISGTPTASGTFNYSIPLTGGCGSVNATGTITVTPAPVVAAITGATNMCVGSLTLYSNVTPGGVWSSGTPSVATIDGFGVITGVSAGSSVIGYAVTVSGCTTTVTKNITVDALPVVAAITGAANVCIGSTTPYSNVTPGGVWSSGTPVAATIDAAGVITGVSAGSAIISYAVTIAGCTTTVTKSITVDALPATSAIGGLNSVCAIATLQPYSVTNTPGSTYAWTITGGFKVGGGNSNAITVLWVGFGPGNVSVQETNAASCVGTPVNLAVLKAAPPSASNAGADQLTACGTVSLAGNAPTTGLGTWGFAPAGTGDGNGSFINSASNTSGFNGTPGQTYTLRWTISNGACTPTTDDVIITFNNPGVTPANAGADQDKCNDGNFTLAANSPAVTETGTWTLISGTATITTASSNVSTVTGVTGSAVLRWTNSDGGTCSSFDEVTLTNSPTPTTAAAGGDQTVCGTSATLAANTPISGTGAWSIVSGAGGSVTAINDPASPFTGVAGSTYVLRWTITSGSCSVSTDDVSIQLDGLPTVAAAGSDQNNACGTISLNANTPTVGGGVWTIVSGAGGAFVDATDPQTDFNGTTGITYVLQWSISNGVCTTSTDDVTITYDPVGPTTADAGLDQSVCGATATTLAGNTPTTGIGQWSFDVGNIGTGGSFSNVINPLSGFTGTIGQTYTLKWTITFGTCSSFDLVSIQFNQSPSTAVAGGDQVICGTNTTLNATAPAIGTGAWSITSGAGGTVTSVNSPTSAFSGTAGQVYILTWSVTNGSCTATTDDVQITFGTANLIVFNSNHCQNSGSLDLTTLVSATPAGGSLTFTGTGVTGSTFDPTGLSGVQNISVQYVSGGCTVNNSLLINVLLPTNPTCTGGGGGGGTGTCATVVIVPKPSPATCTNSDGKIIFSIKPFVPIINNTGVKIDIQGISATNLSISRTNINDSTFLNLPLGTYDFTIEYGDAACIKTGQVTIDQSGTIGTPVATNIVKPICFGMATGSLTLDVPGETGNLLEWSLDGVVWTQFTAGNVITGVPAGLAPLFERAISVRKNSTDPCNAAVTVVIQDANPDIIATIVPVSASCLNNDGSLVISNIGGGTGIANFTYKLNGVSVVLPPDNTLKGLAAGPYIFSIVDNIGCQKDFGPVGVQFPGFINTTGPTVTPPDCNGVGSNGIISFIITDIGTFQVGYTLDAIVEPTNYFNPGGATVTITNLANGNYFIWVKSSGSQCATKLSPVSVNGVYPVSFTSSATDVLCFGNKAEITLTSIKGAPNVNYTYELVKDGVTTTGSVTFSQSLGDVKIPDITAGSYQIRLTQNQSSIVSACTTPIATGYQNVTISGATKALDTLFVTKVISLPDQATGSLLIGIEESEEEPYEVRLELMQPLFPSQAFVQDWTIAQRNTQNLIMELSIKNLFAGDYQLSIRDALGCVKDYPISLKVDTDIYVPNVFTPNDDGVNDVFFIRNLPSDAILIVTNRWGKEVYTSRSYQNDWGGGENSDGVYYYKLSLPTESITGWIEIMRGK